jgi:hypothetical protein
MVALRKAPLALQFAGGVETKQDSKQVPVARLLDLQNATFIKQTTLAKRNGYRKLGAQIEGSLAQMTNPKGLASRDTELVKFSGGHAFSYLAGTDRWSDEGAVDSVVASDVPLARTGTQQTMPDVATNGGITVAAWEDSQGGVWASVVDAVSQRIIAAPTQLDAAGTRPRCVPCGGLLHIYYVNAALGMIYVVVVNPALPMSPLAPAVLTADLSLANPSYDAEPTLAGYSADKPAIIAWAQGGGVGAGFRIGYVHPSGVLGSPLTGLPSVGTVATGINGAIQVAWWQTNPNQAAAPRALVMFVNGSSLGYRFMKGTDFTDLTLPSGNALTFTAGIQRVACAFADTDATGNAMTWFAAEVAGGGDASTNFVKTGSVNIAGVVTLLSTIRGHGLLSRGFYDNGDVYVTLVHPVFFFTYAAVQKISSSSTPAAARLLPVQVPGLPTRTHLSSVMALGALTALNTSRQHGVPVLTRVQLSSANGDKFSETGIRFVTLDFDNAAAWQTAKLGRGLYLASACMQHYDGRRWAEADFHCAPDTTSGTIVTAQGVGGALTLLASYVYKLVYEEVDAQGETHRGAVSAGTLIALTGGNNKVTITLPTYRLTNKKLVRIGVFRSPANQTGDPDAIPYYRVTSTDPTVGGANGYVLNDSTVDTLTFVDGMSDATLLTEEPLYTNGGVLSNDPPAFGGGVLAGGKNRLYWTDPSDPNLVHFSQELADDVAIEMAQPLTQRIDPYGGNVVGIGVLDDAIVVFKETAIHAFNGPGPLPNPFAGQNGWTPPTLLTSDVGCKSPRSICQTPIGIAFQSQKGIKLLGRDRQVVDIGAPVYAYNNQTIVRATLLPDRHQIVFLTNAGRTLLYDYEKQQWSTFTNHEGLDAVVVNGTYNYLRNDGRVFVETPGVYADDNSHIPMVIETAWIKFAGFLQGWQRILSATLLGAYKSSHSLRMSFRLDYENSYNRCPDVAVDNVYAPDVYGAGAYGTGAYGGPVQNYGSVYQQTFDLNQRCQAISFKIEDVEATTAFGAAFELSELAIVGGVLGPQFPTGAARQN